MLYECRYDCYPGAKIACNPMEIVGCEWALDPEIISGQYDVGLMGRSSVPCDPVIAKQWHWLGRSTATGRFDLVKAGMIANPAIPVRIINFSQKVRDLFITETYAVGWSNAGAVGGNTGILLAVTVTLLPHPSYPQLT